MQPMPIEEIRARVLTVKPRIYFCCVCHQTWMRNPRYTVCLKPECQAEARERGWLGL